MQQSLTNARCANVLTAHGVTTVIYCNRITSDVTANSGRKSTADVLLILKEYSFLNIYDYAKQFLTQIC
jgi:hypothetical protein